MSGVPSIGNVFDEPEGHPIRDMGLEWIIRFNEQEVWEVVHREENITGNYSRNLQQWRADNPDWTDFFINSFTLQEHPCVLWAEQNRLHHEELLFLQHHHAFTHMASCYARNSFHYLLFHQMGVRSVEGATNLINQGWRLDRNLQLTNRRI